jgi:hypothetical protein
MIEYIYLYKNELNNRFEYVFCLNKFKCKNYNLKTKTINFNQFYIDKMSYNGILSNTSKSISRNCDRNGLEPFDTRTYSQIRLNWWLKKKNHFSTQKVNLNLKHE